MLVIGGANGEFAAEMSVGPGTFGRLVLLTALRASLRSACSERANSIPACAYPGRAIRFAVVAPSGVGWPIRLFGRPIATEPSPGTSIVDIDKPLAEG